MIVLAYDGSINGDWVARYAMRLAQREPESGLALMHVRGADVDPEVLDAKLRRLADACRRLEISLDIRLVKARGGVAATLASAAPRGPCVVLVCGARLRGGRRGYLSGTVSEALLKEPGFNVLAVRCVQPGLLGNPHELLWPIGARPEAVSSGIPFVRLFASGIRRLHLLRVMTVGRFNYRHLQAERLDELRRLGDDYLSRVEEDLSAQAELDPGVVFSEVHVAYDREHEIALCARRCKSQLILIWAAQEYLSGRFFFGNPLEQLLRNAPCDVAVYRGTD